MKTYGGAQGYCARDRRRFIPTSLERLLSALCQLDIGYKLSSSIIANEQKAKILNCCKYRESNCTTHTIYILHIYPFLSSYRTCKDTIKKVKWSRKKASGLAVLTNGFQWLTSPLHQFYQTLIKYS